MCSEKSKAHVRKGVELKICLTYQRRKNFCFRWSLNYRVKIPDLCEHPVQWTIEMPPAAPQHFEFEHLLRAPVHPFFRSRMKQCRHMNPLGSCSARSAGAPSPCFIGPTAGGVSTKHWAGVGNSAQPLWVTLFSVVVCLEMEHLLLSLPFSEAFFKMKSTA